MPESVCHRRLSGARCAPRLRRHRRLDPTRAERDEHPAEAIEGVRAVLRILIVFALVTPFWSLFDQKASTWVFQADAMVEAELVPVVADAGAESRAGDAAHPVQQLRPLSRAAPPRLRADRAAPHDCRASRSPVWPGSWSARSSS